MQNILKWSVRSLGSFWKVQINGSGGLPLIVESNYRLHWFLRFKMALVTFSTNGNLT